jgi:putative DNA-invertase from lambdoid prophage Rac
MGHDKRARLCYIALCHYSQSEALLSMPKSITAATPSTRRERAARANRPITTSHTFAYVRVSTEEQAETGQSLQVQEQQLRGWAMQHGRTIDEVVVEAGISGGIPFHERPEGSRLWQLAQRGDTVVAAKLDRMFRSASDCLAVVEAFKSRGVSLFLLDLNGGADDVSGNGIARLFLTIVSAFAEFERDRIGERIRATKRAQKARGEHSGGPLPFGYRAEGRQLVRVPEQQRAIKRICAWRDAGLSLRAISAKLAERGIRLSHVAVGRVLSDAKQGTP